MLPLHLLLLCTSDLTRFRPWSPIATGNHLDRAEKFQKVLRRLSPLTFLIHIQAFRDTLRRASTCPNFHEWWTPTNSWNAQLLSYWFSWNLEVFQDWLVNLFNNLWGCHCFGLSRTRHITGGKMKVHRAFVSEVWPMWKESCSLVPVCVGCDLFFKCNGLSKLVIQNLKSTWMIIKCVVCGCIIILLTYKVCLFRVYDALFPEIPYKYALTFWRLKFRLYVKSELLSLQETVSICLLLFLV